MIAPGSFLYDASKRFVATVRTDGSIESGGHTGSIHKVGATLQNAPACNGWTFWHYRRDSKLEPIDRLRENYLLATRP